MAKLTIYYKAWMKRNSESRNDETFENGIGRFNILVAHPAIKVQWFQGKKSMSTAGLKIFKITDVDAKTDYLACV